MTDRYEESDFERGFQTVKLQSWHDLHDYIRKEFLDLSHFVWRGQRDADWRLQSGLDREIEILEKLSGKAWSSNKKNALAAKHLRNFKQAARGRRGPSPSQNLEDSDWWALGQHHGLATPLLDWSEAPFVALYFAFFEESAPRSGFRTVWALGSLRRTLREVEARNEPTLHFLRPMQDENARLVNQAGLFTQVPVGLTVEEWVLKNYVGKDDEGELIKIMIPDIDRIECLKTLNRMNINHKSLFPDLFGSGIYCNELLKIPSY